MLTVLVAAKRLPTLTLEQFTEYWVHHHAPLVLGTPGFARYLRRYVIYPLLNGSGDGDLVLGKFPGYDGIGELRFDSAEAMNAAYADPEYQAIILPDEHKFLDRDACLTFFTDPKVQKELVA